MIEGSIAHTVRVGETALSIRVIESRTHLEQVDVVLSAQSLDELDVVLLLAVGGEDAQVSLAPANKIGEM